MKISIAMCTFNGQTYLQEQLKSFSEQTLQPDELIVCDDGSTDETIQILETFAESAPFPVRIVRNPMNLGSTRNFVQAMSLCTGDLIALSDQDDLWKQEKLAILSEELERNHLASAAFSDGELIDAQSIPTGRLLWQAVGYTEGMQALVNRGQILAVLKRQYFMTGATLMLRAEARSLFPPIPTGWIHDASTTWKFAIYGKLISVPLPLIAYRIHAGNQVGVRRSSVMRMLKQHSAAQVTTVLGHEIAQLAALRDEASSDLSRRIGAVSEALEIVEGRLTYLQQRVALLRTSRATRPWHALLLRRQYHLYDKGWSSLLADLAR